MSEHPLQQAKKPVPLQAVMQTNTWACNWNTCNSLLEMTEQMKKLSEPVADNPNSMEACLPQVLFMQMRLQMQQTNLQMMCFMEEAQSLKRDC
jgi:hypothetical protein